MGKVGADQWVSCTAQPQPKGKHNYSPSGGGGWTPHPSGFGDSRSTLLLDQEIQTPYPKEKKHCVNRQLNGEWMRSLLPEIIPQTNNFSLLTFGNPQRSCDAEPWEATTCDAAKRGVVGTSQMTRLPLMAGGTARQHPCSCALTIAAPAASINNT